MDFLKRFFCIYLSFFIVFSTAVPAFAETERMIFTADDKSPINVSAVPNTIVHSNTVIPLVFMESFNANASEVGMPVKFKLEHDFTDADGDTLPANTIFYGKIDELTKSRLFFRRASAKISINKMVLPDGRSFLINAKPEQKELKSPVAANIAKGAATTAAAAGVGMVGAIVIAVECLSIGGVLLAPYTGAAVGIALASTTKGVNFKVPAGTKIYIKFDQPVDAFY